MTSVLGLKRALRPAHKRLEISLRRSRRELMNRHVIFGGLRARGDLNVDVARLRCGWHVRGLEQRVRLLVIQQLHGCDTAQLCFAAARYQRIVE